MKIEYYGADAVSRCKNSDEYKQAVKLKAHNDIKISIVFITFGAALSGMAISILLNNPMKALGITTFLGGIAGRFTAYVINKPAEFTCPAFIYEFIEDGASCPKNFQKSEFSCVKESEEFVHCIGIVDDATILIQ